MAANTVAVSLERESDYVIATWDNMIADSTGEAVDLPGYELVSAQAKGGAYDTSGEIDIEGSNDGSTYVVLPDNVDGSDVTFSADGIKAPGLQTRQYRPKTAANGSAGGVDVDIVAYFRPLR